MFRNVPTHTARRQLRATALCGLALLTTNASADVTSTESAAAQSAAETWAVHGQFTYVEQETDRFRAPYAGPNSLSRAKGAETIDATLYAGRALWPGAEAWINVEVDQGFGLDNTLGAAGFPSGEAYKVGKTEPYLRLTRSFVRQTWNLGHARVPVAGGQNQLAGSQSADRVVFTVGKFGVADVFDTNQYAHDPRGDFLNWAALDAATFDYAADAWGYSVGAALEWYTGMWVFRSGLFDLSDVPNSPHLDPGAHEFQSLLEVERRFRWRERSGRVLVTAYQSHGRMGLLADAVALSESSGAAADVAAVRRYRDRTGISLALEQELTDDVGAFARVGGASGNVEVYEFTDVDRTATAGASLKGTRWGRPNDVVGGAAIVNEISRERRDFLDHGGLGLLIGDGALPHPASERIAELYYSLATGSFGHVALDYQRIENPAYNHDRGPVSVFALRVHAQF